MKYSIDAELDEIRRRRAKGTGEWLTKSEGMKAWLEGDEQLFVVTGPREPPCFVLLCCSDPIPKLAWGKQSCRKLETLKDCLPSYSPCHRFIVHEYLKEDSERVVLPVFIKFTSNMDIETILRRLVACLVRHPRAAPIAAQLLLHENLNMEEKDLIDILKSAKFPLHIVVDALDELQTFKEKLIPLLLGIGPTVKVFVTSRPLLQQSFGVNLPILVSLESSDGEDLNYYIKTKVQELVCVEGRNPEDVSALEELVIKHSAGL